MYPNWDAIFERLETTKQFGLLADYLVSWSGRSGRLSPKVTVWGGRHARGRGRALRRATAQRAGERAPDFRRRRLEHLCLCLQQNERANAL